MRKGISPFVSMALLIAIVVAAAFIVGEWVQPFTQSQTQIVENRSADVHACAETRINILDAHYENGEVRITVMNAGFIDLENVNVVLLGAGEVINQTGIGSLSSGDITSEALDTGGDTPDRVVAISETCPMISDEEVFEQE